MVYGKSFSFALYYCIWNNPNTEFLNWMIQQYSWYVPLLDRILICANPMAPLSGNFKGFSDWTCKLPIWMYWHCFQQVWFFRWKWWKACAFIVLPNIGQKWKKEKEMILRLCLFRVKIFLIVLEKKIFSSVWLRF